MLMNEAFILENIPMTDSLLSENWDDSFLATGGRRAQ